MESDEDVIVLRRGLDQLGGLLGDVGPDALDRSTPCAQWTVGDLVDHVVATPSRLARMTRGEKIDWTAATAPAGDDPTAAFASGADDLVRAWQEAPDTSGPSPLDWQSAELAVHTWDLATALGRSTADFDAEIAERGLTFMRANLTPDTRGPAFGPEQPAPDGANAYERSAAFAGRSV